MADSILWNAWDAIATAIRGLTTAGGYSANWGSVDVYEDAHKVYPAADLDITEEENLDEGPHVGAYTNVATLTIEVNDKLAATAQFPHKQIKKQLLNRIDDLKRLFGLNPSLGGVFYVQYQGFEITPTDDMHTSGRALVTFTIQYTQDRTSPQNGAC
jgi:hypothetical protein